MEKLKPYDFRDSKKSFLPNTSSARKKTKDITFTKKVWKNVVPGGTLICF